MSMLDLRTVVITGFAVDVVCTVVMVALWRQNRRRFGGLSCWALDFVFQTCGLLLIILRGAVPDCVSILFAHMLVFTGALLGYIGLERFTGRRSSQLHNYVYLAAAGVAHAYFTYIRPDVTLRSINVALVLLVVCGQCAWLLLRRVDTALRSCTRWVGIVFGVYTAVFAVRVVWLIAHPLTPGDYFHTGAAEPLFHLLLQMLFVLLTYALGLMVNRRLLMAVQIQEEKFAAAFHAAPYAILLTRVSDGRIFEVNRGFTAITGYAPHEAIGHTTLELKLWQRRDDRITMLTHLRARGEVDDLQFQFRNKSGALFTGLLSAVTIVIRGEPCVLASVRDITERQRAAAERERLIAERERSLSELRILSGLLPICAACKKIRDDKGYWNQIESYIRTHSQAEFSHGLCPECAHQLYPDYASDAGQAGPANDAGRTAG